MIRRLRWKITGVTMLVASLLLLAAFGGVYFSSRASIADDCTRQLRQMVQTGVSDSRFPCLVAEVLPSGTVRVTASSYYQLPEESTLLEAVTQALASGQESGVLEAQHMRFYRQDGPLSVRIAFMDSTLEQSTLRSLVSVCLLIGGGALLVLLGLSWLLSGFVTRPVARTWRNQQQFVSDASHELKTPLAGIRLLTDSILQTDNMDPETTKEFVTDIGREAERLSRITENLLRLTRLDSGVVQQPYPVAVAPVLERVERMLAMVAAEKGVTLSGAADEEAVALATDDDVHQILYNLMENAIKYSRTEEGFVHARAWAEDGRVYIAVSDNGIGIPDEDLPHVFDRFYRVDKMRSREVGGTGLGLSIVKDTIENRGGTITAGHGEGGVGTVFTVTLPLAERGEEV